MFLMRSNGKLLGTVLSFTNIGFLTMTLELIMNNLSPSVVGKGPVGLSHFVGVLTLFNSYTLSL